MAIFLDANEDYDVPVKADPISLEDMVIIKEEKDMIAKAIKRLTLQERNIIVLRYYWQLSWREIAGIWNSSKNAMINKHSRLMKKLHDMLKAEDVIEG